MSEGLADGERSLQRWREHAVEISQLRNFLVWLRNNNLVELVDEYKRPLSADVCMQLACKYFDVSWEVVSAAHKKELAESAALLERELAELG